MHTDPDLTFRQRLRESIRSRDTRSTTFYPKFDQLLESFNELVLKANEENRPQFEKRFFPESEISPDVLLLLQNIVL